MDRIAVIDIGTNAVKLLIGERREDGRMHAASDESRIVRLGEGLRETGRLSEKALERNAQAVAAFAEQARQSGAARILCVGTMALRMAENRADFLARVDALCGVQVQVISGEEEARLSCQAVLSTQPIPLRGETVIFDTGGGSTEFIYVQEGAVQKRISVPLGAVGLTESCLQGDPVAEGAVAEALWRIEEALDAAGICGSPEAVIGIGGAVTTMGAVERGLLRYAPAQVDGMQLSLADVRRQVAAYACCTLSQRCGIPGMQPGRADVILGGACIVEQILTRLSAPALTVSVRGLRHGLAYEALNGTCR